MNEISLTLTKMSNDWLHFWRAKELIPMLALKLAKVSASFNDLLYIDAMSGSEWEEYSDMYVL